MGINNIAISSTDAKGSQVREKKIEGAGSSEPG